MTNFNTGHGTKYFVDGTELSPREWTNRSIQDIPPTWQWTVQSSGTKLYPDYDWDTAYYGGTSLEVSGDLNADNTLKLYMTDLPVSSNTDLKVIYKRSVAGDSKMKVALTFADNMGTPVYFDLGTATGNWDSKTISLSSHAGRSIAMVNLFFDGSSPVTSYQMNIGKLAIVNPDAIAPAAPSNIQIVQSYTGNIINTTAVP